MEWSFALDAETSCCARATLAVRFKTDLERLIDCPTASLRVSKMIILCVRVALDKTVINIVPGVSLAGYGVDIG